MSDQVKTHKSEEKDPEVVIESAIGRTEMFIMKNGKLLLTILAVVVVVVGGFFGYKYLVVGPRGEKAMAAMFIAEQQFAVDSFSLALKGDGNFDGFEAVAAKYGSTPAGNLAKHYAGICYMNMGQFEDALASFKSYKNVSGVPGSLMNAQNYGLQGDAYSQLENYKDAVSMYEKAAHENVSSLTAPFYLKKAGLVYEKLGDNATALKTYKKIAADYANSLEARDVQKYIGRLEQL